MSNVSSSAAPASFPFGADFWKFWLGQTISSLGSSFTLVALPLLVLRLTGSALDLAISSALSYLPYLLFGLVIGAWVDRFNRKRLMIAVDLVRMGLTALVPLVATGGAGALGWIYALGFVNTTLAIAFGAAQFAALPSLVPERSLVAANGRVQASTAAAGVVGPLLAGLALSVLPLTAVFLIDACSFGISALTLAWTRTSFNQAPKREARPLRQEVAEGLRFVLRHPVLRTIAAMMVLVNGISSSTYAQITLFSKQHLHASDAQIALLFAAESAGVFVFSLGAGWLRQRFAFGPVALGALALSGLLSVALALTPSYETALVLWGLIAGLNIVFNIATSSLRQALVPNALLGRVMTVSVVLATLAIPLGTFLGGLVIAWTGDVVLVYAIIGALRFAIAGAFALTTLGRAEQYLQHDR